MYIDTTDFKATNSGRKTGKNSAKYEIKTQNHIASFEFDKKQKSDPKYREEAANYFKPFIVNSVRRYCYVPSEFDDLVQDGILILFQCMDTYDDKRGVPFAAYVNSYLRFYYLKTYRYLNQQTLSLDQDGEEGKIYEVIDSGVDIEKEYFKKFDVEFLNFVMKNLSKREREIIYLCYYENKKLKDVAAQLGIATRTATNLKFRAMCKLRDYFKEDI